METKKAEKSFDAVKMMREIRDKISIDTAQMSYKELKKYISEKLKQGELVKTGK